MNVGFLKRLWEELRRRKLLGETTPVQLSGGNSDRRPSEEKATFKVQLADGSSAKITVGKGIAAAIAGAKAWAAAYPEVAAASLFDLQFEEYDVHAETFFEGYSLGEAVTERRFSAAAVHAALGRIASSFPMACMLSTEDARRAEWEDWCARLLAVPVWTIPERSYLETRLLPALYRRLTTTTPGRRWIHGDLTDGNIFISTNGAVGLIDAEFAQTTHFSGLETAHFFALSQCWREQPSLFSSIIPTPAPEWQLYAWLNQLLRETKNNSAEYLQRWLPDRLDRIARLAQQLDSISLSYTPWISSINSDATLVTAQLFRSTGEPWTETRSVLTYYNSGKTQNLFFRIASSAEFLRFDPSTSDTEMLVHRMAFHADEPSRSFEYAGPALHRLRINPLGDTVIGYAPEGLTIRATSGDPQIAWAVDEIVSDPSDGWLEIEVGPAQNPHAISEVVHYFDEARWMDQPSAFGLRLAGWCVISGNSRLRAIEAFCGPNLLARSSINRREDVAKEFPQHVNAAESGFVLEIPVVPLESHIRLIAHTSDGRSLKFFSAQAGTFPNFGVVLGSYRTWAKAFDRDPDLSNAPVEGTTLFSILLPVFNTSEKFLRECIQSVRQQHYPNWELCVIDDASTAPWMSTLLDDVARLDPRIKVQRRATNGGIAQATNDALALATGDYVIFLDHDDLLRSHALATFAQEIRLYPGIDAFYSDEDKITEAGERLVPFLKPAFSPEFLLHVMYIGHALCVRSAAARKCGGFDSTYDGVQDYEFFLRLTEHTRQIRHIPRILYHWRQSASSSALHGNVKGDMDEKQLRAVRAHLARRNSAREVSSLGRHRLRITSGTIAPTKRVALILGWPIHRDHAGCDWGALLQVPAELHVMEHISLPYGNVAASRLSMRDPASMVRHVAGFTAADVIVLLTAAPLELSVSWLTEIATQASMADAACVAPILLSREGTVLEAGWMTGGADPAPIMRGFDPAGDGYNGSLLANREVAAVSPSCVALRRELAANCGAEQVSDWITACQTAAQNGRFNRVCAAVRIRVDESWRWAPTLRRAAVTRTNDDFYNPNFRADPADYRLGFPPRHLAEKDARFVTEIETPPPLRLCDGCLTLRGWSFRPDRRPVSVKAEVAGISWTIGCHQPRPDVTAMYTGLTDEGCGFTLHLRLPPGEHMLLFQAHAPDSASETLLQQRIVVPRTAAWRRWLHPDHGNRAAFQMMAAPSSRPHPVRAERFPVAKSNASTRPRLSIITPSYQQARFLRETIDSVLNQGAANLEYIVQDGGSTDGSLELIQSYAPRLSAWEHAKDRGQADAVARGFAKSSGAPEDVMAWINSDDFYLPDALSYVAQYFARHPEVDVLYGNRVVVDGESREIGRWYLPAHDPAVLRLNDYVPQETLFWRRRIWDKVGGLDISHQFALDWDLLLRFQEANARIVHVPYFLACFRVHATQKTSAAIHTLGREEIDRLRRRALGRELAPAELEHHPRLIRYVRRSAEIEFLWRYLRLRCH